MHFSTKTYTHAEGLSCCFRQWRASHSHCQYLHGYAIEVKFQWEATELDARNWVVDFGGLKHVKEWLKETFDHKLLVAKDDPKLEELHALNLMGLAQVVEVEAVGCEAFAKMIYDYVNSWTRHSFRRLSVDGIYVYPVKLVQVEVREHGGNSAGYRRD